MFSRTILKNKNQTDFMDLFGYNFWKPFSVFKNNENTQNKDNTFHYLFFFFEKQNINIKKQEQFSKNTKMMFFVFSKVVLKNSFQKLKPNRP